MGIVAMLTAATSCQFDDTDIWNEMEQIKSDLAALTERVNALETKLQGEIDAVKALVEGQVVVVDVVNNGDGTQTIKLSNGDEITVLVQKFNDPEGIVLVSKKRVDSRAGWAKTQEAFENGVTLSGKVSSVIKGGILVSDELQSYFVPASLTGAPKGANLDTMLGQVVAF